MPGMKGVKPLPAVQKKRLAKSYTKRVQARPKPKPEINWGGHGNPVAVGGGEGPFSRLGGFLGDAARGAADVARVAVSPGDRRVPARVAREGSRQMAEQSGMAAIDRMRRGEFRREDALLLASMGVSLTPAGAAARGGMAGRMLSLPRGGYSAQLIQGQLADIMRILAEASQRKEYGQRRR